MSVYSTVPIARPRRTGFPLTHSYRTMVNIGEVFPSARPIEMVPGDTFKTAQVSTVDLMPLVSPFKGDLYLESWQFFCSYDMLEKEKDGGSFTDILLTATDPRESKPIPTITVANNTKATNLGSLWDKFGLPLGIGNNVSHIPVLAYDFRAYYKIWDEWIRDENLQDTIFESEDDGFDPDLQLYNINYKKDRFTSAFTEPQKGPAISISLGTNAPVIINGKQVVSVPNSQPSITSTFKTADNVPIPSGSQLQVDLRNSTAVTIEDFRLLNKLQRWEERNQLCGSRAKEFYLANYGVAPNDETLNRPVLIGHTKTPIIVNSVVQNNPTADSKASTKTGNGTGILSTSFGRWTAKEFGVLITLSALRPRASYTQGIHRSFIKSTVYDFFHPMFESLGQQEIFNAEIFASNSAEDGNIFGYTDRYNEMRAIEDITTGVLRDNLEPWAVSRKFASLPSLSSDFIQVQASEYDYLFNFQHSQRTPQAIISATNVISAYRPISKYAHPSI